MEIGNVITVVLVVIGVVAVLALTGRWGQRPPWWTAICTSRRLTPASRVVVTKVWRSM
ncbi:hypothetical protein [Micromonospora sp. NBC_00617]|uniref:hypothetical protein n=1 Tax=Micromonospora sp. NBC_00617 TaxID=2903587 RepID=UPI0030E2C930